MADMTVEDAKPTFKPRGYQQELLEESLRQNIIIALDTGSGKTHIAILRMKHETERNSNKVCWFLAPTVALIEQQHKVISDHIPVSVGKISGASEPDQWKDRIVWEKLLRTHRILVSTPQILLDALLHGYVSLGQVGLLIFDEAHHAVAKHPYNMIMKDHYMPLPRRTQFDHPNARVRPMILGLTASPVYGGDVAKAFNNLEGNLDSVIRSARRNREELMKFVNRPVFKHVIYDPPYYTYDEITSAGPSLNVIALHRVTSTLKLDEDPYVISLRKQLSSLRPGEERYKRLDQKLSKTIAKRDTFTFRGMNDFCRAASEICFELGAWAADWYVYEVIEHAKRSSTMYNSIMASWKEEERSHIIDVLSKALVAPPSSIVEQIVANVTPRVHKLIECLIQEEKFAREEEPFSGIVFVTRRDSVLALSEILRRIPETAELFRPGSLLGSSNSSKRHAFLDITRFMLKESAVTTLQDFRLGEKNLIISTAVAEEGIDIQACGCVIRFDLPPNMVSWAQSRGRARRKKSTLIMMIDNTAVGMKKIRSWEDMEAEMMKRYIEEQKVKIVDDDDEMLDDDVSYRVESTGAMLTLHSAVSHLHHFCSVLSSSRHEHHVPLFDLDPPEFPEGWHADGLNFAPPPQEGPWRVTCILPRVLPPHLRTTTTDKFYPSKKSARYHAAFQAYVKLHKAGQLDDHLLPHFSVVNNDTDGQVKFLLQDVEKRAGMANVPIQMDPWDIAPTFVEAGTWWCQILTIGDLPPLRLLTGRSLPEFALRDLPTLHDRTSSDLAVSLVPCPTFQPTAAIVASAQQYTHRMFSSFHGLRMDQKKVDFAYLFLPVNEDDEAEVAWNERRSWMAGRFARSEHQAPEKRGSANAALLLEAFGSTLDWAIVRQNDKFSKILRFVGWHDGPITESEEEDLRKRYGDYEGPIKFPLLVAEPFPRRTNMLAPPPVSQDSSGEHDFLLFPEFVTVDLISQRDVTYARRLPSFLRWLAKAITVTSLRDKLFEASPLADIPLSILMEATTAPVSQESNYQRLETLGDTVLKYVVGIQLFSHYETWGEGYLARRKDHSVNNSRLALDAIERGLHTWIIRDRFMGKKWKPRYISDGLTPTTEPEKAQVAPPPDAKETTLDLMRDRRQKRKKKAQELSTKVIADVVEALIGAAYEHGGFVLAVKCMEVFGLGMPRWETIADRVATALSRVQMGEDFPLELGYVEQMIGYKFKRRMLLVEALTHVTYQGDLNTISYERLEFLGDSVLDMIVTDYLYHAPKGYKPGDMHVRKEALVNTHFLAYTCLNTFLSFETAEPTWNPFTGLTEQKETKRVYLWQCLLHSSSRVLDDQSITFARFEKHSDQIAKAFEKSIYYPWALITGLQAPKFFSDMVESLLGAVFLDSNGDLEVAKGVLKTLGMYGVMERIVHTDVQVLHPVSQLGIWAAKQIPQKKLKLEMLKKDGNISCTVLLDNEQVARSVEKFRGVSTRNGVRYAAADAAIKELKIFPEEVLEDVEDIVDDWKTAFVYGPAQYDSASWL